MIEETVGVGEMTRNVEMPLLTAIGMKEKLKSAGGVELKNSVYTSGPRTIFSIIVELKKKVNIFTTDIWDIKIYGEFLNDATRGDVNVEYKHVLRTTKNGNGFIHDCLNDFYMSSVYPKVLKRAHRQKITDLI